MANRIVFDANLVESLSADDWAMIEALPVDRLPTLERLAAQLRTSRAAAGRRIARLRRLGVLRDVAVIDLDRPLALVRSLLRGRLAASPGAFAAFADAMQARCVVDAAIISGHQDFEVATLHDDEASALAYFQALECQPFVRSCERSILSVVFSRPRTEAISLRPVTPTPISFR